MTNSFQQDDFEGMETIYEIEQGSSRAKELGIVLTREGRLIAFPNVLQHRVWPFTLRDNSRPGHRKILALFLVDPYIPVISTANVPPQQLDWWLANGGGDGHGHGSAKLPAELLSALASSRGDTRAGAVAGRDGLGGGPVFSMQDAKKIREELMEERGRFVDKAISDMDHSVYSFCEH